MAQADASQAVQQNPALIQPLIQQIAGANPQLAQLIAQNPEALLQLLGAGGEEDDMGEYGDMGGEVMQVDLTPEEAAAVERVSCPTRLGSRSARHRAVSAPRGMRISATPTARFHVGVSAARRQWQRVEDREQG